MRQTLIYGLCIGLSLFLVGSIVNTVLNQEEIPIQQIDIPGINEGGNPMAKTQAALTPLLDTKETLNKITEKLMLPFLLGVALMLSLFVFKFSNKKKVMVF